MKETKLCNVIVEKDSAADPGRYYARIYPDHTERYLMLMRESGHESWVRNTTAIISNKMDIIHRKRTITTKSGSKYILAFTSMAEMLLFA